MIQNVCTALEYSIYRNIYRDQDGDSNDLDENARLGTRCTSMMSGSERIQSGKCMSIMNTQQSSREKGEHQTQRNLAATNDNTRTSSNYQSTALTTGPPSPMSANVGCNASGSNNNMNISAAVTGSNNLDHSTNGSHLSNSSTAASLNNQAREPK